MSRQYPIWNEVEACIYKSNKSYGAKRDSITKVRIGTSSSNSHLFVRHRTSRRELENGDSEFRFFVDDVCVKRAVVTKDKKMVVLDETETTNKENHEIQT